jgi:hypothetical protein
MAEDASTIQSMTTRNDLKRMIPLTPIRHFYDRMRDFVSEELHWQLACECFRRTDLLQDLVQSSFEHFCLYQNSDEPFRPSSGNLTPSRIQNQDSANQLLSLVAQKGAVTVNSSPELEVDFVDYDISPIRTTSSYFENGRSGKNSGIGGADILLSNRKDRLPCVGEIKAETDRNPFLGLIQSLMYAVELSTPAQRARLAQSYPGSFDWPVAGPWIDICLMLIRYPQSSRKKDFLDLVQSIVVRVLAPNTPISRIVRRVSCLLTEMESPGSIDFNVGFAFPMPINEGSILPVDSISGL